MWLFVTMIGLFAIDEKTGEVYRELFGGEPPKIEVAKDRLSKFEELKDLPELGALLSKLNTDSVKVNNENLLLIINNYHQEVKAELITNSEELQQMREIIGREISNSVGGREKYNEMATLIGIELTKSKIMEEGEKRDQMIIKAVTIQEDLTKMFNILASHVREWYGFYFHDLGKLIDDHELYLRVILELGRIENFTKENLSKIIKDEKLVEKILKAKEETVPIKITEKDLERIKAICKLALDIEEERRKMMEYLDELMEEAAPNIKSLVGPIIGAKLIRKAGGLEQLAKMPASTIQILGAEKALFRSLHGRGTPPKHGIIFQDPRIFKSPRWQRGKIARALAGKLAIAARVDYFSGEFIGDELLTSLEKRIAEIKEKYPEPPKIQRKKEGRKPKKPKKKKKGKKKKKR